MRTSMQQTTAKGVRFAEESSFQVEIVESNEEADELRSLDPIDLYTRRVRRRQEVENCTRRDYGTLLDDSFDDPLDDVQRHINLFCQLPYNAKSAEPLTGDQHDTDAATPRGLEEYISVQHNQERKEARLVCIQNVLQEFDRLRFDNGNRHLSDEEKWRVLGKTSRDGSRTARRFARRMGKADARVVLRGELAAGEGDHAPNKALKMIKAIKATRSRKIRRRNSRDHLPLDDSSRRASFSDCTATSQPMQEAKVASLSTEKQRSLVNRCYSWSKGTSKDKLSNGKVEDSDAILDMNDSIFGKRRKRKGKQRVTSPKCPSPPVLATSNEGSRSCHDSANIDNSQQSNTSAVNFMSNWAGGQHINSIAKQNFNNESIASLDLEDLGLVAMDGGDDDDGDSISVHRNVRRGDDLKPQAPPSTRWDSSWSNLDVMEESLTPEDSPVSSRSQTRKVSQLHKAEQWAMQRSCPKLTTSSSSSRKEPKDDRQRQMITGARRQKLQGMSTWKSTPTLFDSADAMVVSEKRRGSKTRQFLNRWNMSLRSFAEDEKAPDGTRSKEEKMRRSENRNKMLNDISSNPALDGANSRDLFDRTPSDLTAESTATGEGSSKPLRRSSMVGIALSSFGSFRKKSKDKGHQRSESKSRSILLQPQLSRS